MQRASPPRRFASGAAGAVALLALVGTWLGHSLEYLRVGGPGLQGSLVAGMHPYMLPTGGLLILAAAIGGVGWWRAWRRLGVRLDRARDALLRAWRGERISSVAACPIVPVRPPARLLSLWLPLGAVQSVLYLIQENLEAILSGSVPPGLGPVLGVHWAAAAIQFGVALVLAAGLLVAGRMVARRVHRVERCERVLRTLWGRLLRGLEISGARASMQPPVERFGPHLWSRPPPALLL